METMKTLSALMLMFLATLFVSCNKVVLPTVNTSQPKDVTATGCMAGGVIVDNGGAEISECGVCWGTEAKPDITGNHSLADLDGTIFSCQIEGLLPETTYYLRAYATNEAGVGYGESVRFTTQDDVPASPIGTINGLFSVSDTKQVLFSKGNLQYQASTDTWRFAERQWDYVGSQHLWEGSIVGGTVPGSDNAAISDHYNGWIDLFGWGTSGWNPGNLYYHPWDIDDDDEYYGPQGVSDLTGEYASCDWGHNAISNGGNLSDTWRTLTAAEWTYLFVNRTLSCGFSFVFACVDGVNGLILLPDDWQASYYPLNGYLPDDDDDDLDNHTFSDNIINAAEWNNLEQHGAVFLPGAGFRDEVLVVPGNPNGVYWTATCFNDIKANALYFNRSDVDDDTVLDIKGIYRCLGLSVRLVRDVNN